VFTVKSGNIDMQRLMCFALMNCIGSTGEKADVLFRLFTETATDINQDRRKQKLVISSTNYAIETVLAMMIELASFDLAILIEEFAPELHIDRSIKYMRRRLQLFDFTEQYYMEPTFGTMSKMSHKRWMNITTTSSKVNRLWFESQNLRGIIFSCLDELDHKPELAHVTLCLCKTYDIKPRL